MGVFAPSGTPSKYDLDGTLTGPEAPGTSKI